MRQVRSKQEGLARTGGRVCRLGGHRVALFILFYFIFRDNEEGERGQSLQRRLLCHSLCPHARVESPLASHLTRAHTPTLSLSLSLERALLAPCAVSAISLVAVERVFY